MSYPKLGLILHMIKNGYDTGCDNIDDVKFQWNDIKYMKEFDFKEKNIDTWFGEFYDDLYNSDNNIINELIIEEVFKFEEICELYHDWYNIDKDFIKDIEELMWCDEDDILNIPKDHLKVYLKYKSDFDKDIVVEMEKYSMTSEEYYGKVFNGELDELDENDILNFFEYRDDKDYEAFNLLDKETILKKGFLNSFDNFPKNGKSTYSNFMESKKEMAYILWEFCNFDMKVRKALLDNICYIYEEDLENKELEEKRLKEEEIYNSKDSIIERAENQNRILAEDGNMLLKHLGLNDRMSIIEGHVGLEDMTFDRISIWGRTFEYNESFGKYWIDGRTFGDNGVSYSQFKRAVKSISEIDLDKKDK